jgi:hypothetical protein
MLTTNQKNAISTGGITACRSRGTAREPDTLQARVDELVVRLSGAR